MSALAINPAVTQAVVPKADNASKIPEAARQFEALLLEQILQTVSQGDGWLGSGEDSASGCATSFAEQQLAAMMAKQGGLGLAKLIETGLAAGTASAPTGGGSVPAARHEAASGARKGRLDSI